MAMGLYGFAIMIGPAIGPTLGGYIVDNYSWPWIFYINIPIGIAGLFMVWRVVQDPPYLERSRGQVDWLGLILLVVGLAALQTLLEQGEQYDWFDSTRNVVYALIGGICLAMFVVQELVTDHPIVALRVLRDRSFTTATIIGAVLGAVLFSTLFLLPVYMQDFLRYDAMQTGLALMPRSLVMLVTIPVAGAIYNRVSPKLVIAFGLVLGGITCLQMSRFSLDTSRTDILVPQMLQGVALACIFIPLSTVALATIDRRRMSEATGLNNLIRQLGGSFGVAIFASLLVRYTTQAKSVLGAHVSAGDPMVYGRVTAMARALAGPSGDQHAGLERALRMLDMQVGGQAAMLGFERAFFLGGLMFLASVPLVLLLGDGRYKSASPQEKHEHIAVEL
jgi:DHA2 family multidrug resistance protein